MLGRPPCLARGTRPHLQGTCPTALPGPVTHDARDMRPLAPRPTHTLLLCLLTSLLSPRGSRLL